MKKTLTALLAASMLLTACGEKSTSYDPKNYKGYFVKGLDVTTFNYLTTFQAVDARVNANLMSGLTENNKYGEIVGDLASKWETDEKSKVWTFNLREDLKWVKRDGSEYGKLTAQDFVYGLQYVLDPQYQSMQVSMPTELIEGASEYFDAMVAWDKAGRDASTKPDFSTVGIKALDDNTLQFTTTGEGKPYFLSCTLYSCFYPLNQKFVEDLEAEGQKFGSTPDTILYNGCYTMGDYENDTQKVFVKNQSYWDKDNVTFDTVTELGVKDRESTLDYFNRGELSFADLVATQVTAESEKGNEYMIQTQPTATSFVMYLNNECADQNTAKAIQNENFRKALFHGFDRRSDAEMVDPINPESVYTYGYTVPELLKTSDGTDYTQLGDLKKWQTDQQNKDLALEYKAKAMDELKAEGVTFPVSLPWYSKSGNETAGVSASLLKAGLEEALGTDFVTVDLEEYSQTFRQDVAYENKQALAYAGWAPDYLDPINILDTFTRDGAMNNAVDLKGGQYSHWDIPEFDKMIAEADAEITDLDARYLKFANAEAYLLEHAYFIPIYISGMMYRVSSVNEYSRPVAKSGITGYRYKGIEAFDHAVTAKEQEEFKKTWNEKRVELKLA